jgi:PAS domain
VVILARSRWIVEQQELVVLLQPEAVPRTQNQRLQRHGEKSDVQAVPTQHVVQRAAAREHELQQLVSLGHLPPHHGRSCPLCLQRFVLFHTILSQTNYIFVSSKANIFASFYLLNYLRTVRFSGLFCNSFLFELKNSYSVVSTVFQKDHLQVFDFFACCISVADEPRISPKFLMRHSATGELVHVDTEVVPHFGYLPQDMIGVSVFDFFHPEDMQYLKEVYMTSKSRKCCRV